jgi:hypothetical protein
MYDYQTSLHKYRHYFDKEVVAYIPIRKYPDFNVHERTTTAKNMGLLKYHPTSLISYERGWPLACLEDLIKPNQASHQDAR